MANELEQLEQLDSVLDSVSQIDSELGEVVVITTNFLYAGDIALNDWVQDGNVYKYTVLAVTHTLNNPCLLMFHTSDNSVYKNAMVSYAVDASGDVVFTVDEPVVAKFKLEGER